MKLRGILLLLAVLALALSPLAAGSPWKARSYARWTSEEVQELLNDSPWARRVVRQWVMQRQVAHETLADASSREAPSMDIRTLTRIPVRTMASGRSQYQLNPSGSVPPSSLPVETRSATVSEHLLTVVWFSSRTIREASVRRGLLLGTLNEQAAQDYLSRPPQHHVVVLHGPSLGDLAGVDAEVLRSATYLLFQPSGQKLSPTRIQYLQHSTGGLAEIRFYFPRQHEDSPVVPPRTRKIEFHLPWYGEPLVTVFDVRDMTRDGRPDL